MVGNFDADWHTDACITLNIPTEKWKIMCNHVDSYETDNCSHLCGWCALSVMLLDCETIGRGPTGRRKTGHWQVLTRGLLRSECVCGNVCICNSMESDTNLKCSCCLSTYSWFYNRQSDRQTALSYAEKYARPFTGACPKAIHKRENRAIKPKMCCPLGNVFPAVVDCFFF